MNGITRKFSILAVLLLVVGAAACDSSVQEPTIPVSALLVGDGTGSSYTLPPAKAYPATATVSAVIDRKGGSLVLGDFAMLNVSRNAVAQPTTFTIQVIRDGYIEVRLTATASVRGSTVNVGALGFDQPVHLRLSADYVSGSFAADRLVVLWQVDGTRDGRFQRTSAVDRSGSWIGAKLDHFSNYVMASN